MIESFKGGSSEVKSMIDIKFEQSVTQDKTSMFNYVGCFVVLRYCFVFYLEHAIKTIFKNSEKQKESYQIIM